MGASVHSLEARAAEILLCAAQCPSVASSVKDFSLRPPKALLASHSRKSWARWTKEQIPHKSSSFCQRSSIPQDAAGSKRHSLAGFIPPGGIHRERERPMLGGEGGGDMPIDKAGCLAFNVLCSLAGLSGGIAKYCITH